MKRKYAEGVSPYTCIGALRQGGTETRLSALVMGLGNLLHKQYIKGAIFLLTEVAYIWFMVQYGFYNLKMLISLGSVEQEEIWNEELQVYQYTQGDQSVLLLLYGIATIMITLIMFWIWRGTLKSAYQAECLTKEGRHVNNFIDDIRTLFDDNIHRLLMTPPMFFITALTVLPLIFMICMAFTNYSRIGNHLVLFDWVGLDNFAALFDSNSVLGSTSGRYWYGPWCGQCSPPLPTISSV